jgi:hypothetical protein
VNFLQRPRKKKEGKNPAGLKTANCYRCGAEKFERELIRLPLKTSNPEALTGGDLLLICKGCHNGQGE